MVLIAHREFLYCRSSRLRRLMVGLCGLGRPRTPTTGLTRPVSNTDGSPRTQLISNTLASVAKGPETQTLEPLNDRTQSDFELLHRVCSLLHTIFPTSPSFTVNPFLPSRAWTLSRLRYQQHTSTLPVTDTFAPFTSTPWTIIIYLAYTSPDC